MSHTPAELSALATELFDALESHRYAPRPSHSGDQLSVDDAYAIQAMQLEKFTAQGHRIAAIKLGLTDEAQQQRAGWFAPSFGTLTDQMMIPAAGVLSLSGGLRPRVEPEIVVTLAREITRAIESREELLSAIADVRVGIEIVDPRYEDSEFILADAIADNASAHAGVLGTQTFAPDASEWSAEELVLSIDGVDQVRGRGAALMGDPLRVVADVIAERVRLGWVTPAGIAIFTGNVSGKAVNVAVGQTVVVRGSTLGEVSVRVEA